MHFFNNFFTLLVIFSIETFAQPLPELIYQKSKITPESKYEIYQNAKKAKHYFHKGEQENALNSAIKTLTLSLETAGDRIIDQYDYLYSHYIILSIIKTDATKDKEYIKLSSKLFNYLDDVTSKGIWEESELGLFQMKLYREIGNTMAIKILKNKKEEQIDQLEKALEIIKKAEKYIRSPNDFYIKETKQKIIDAIDENKVTYEIIN